MEIRITIHTTDPLTGTATAESAVPQRFEGWLELLHALATLVGPGAPSERGAPSVAPAISPGEGGSDERADDGSPDPGPHGQ